MAELKIFKSLDARKSNEKFKSEFGQGVISFVSWDRLIPYLNQSVDKKVEEQIEGIKVDEKGIHVKLVKKCK